MQLFKLFSLNIAFLLLLFTTDTMQTLASERVHPKHEVRAVWLTTIGGLDWPHTYAMSKASKMQQQHELCTILDELKCANINTVLLQTRIRGTVIYPSAIEPWDCCLSGEAGVSPGYDALQFAIDECHKRGMELHAWIVTIPIGKWNAHGCRQLRKLHPQIVKRIGNEGYLNPERAETADYLATLCREITDKYDIDGIHLDYIRYPETWKPRPNSDKGRANITGIARKIYHAVKARKPWVKVSCAPIGKHDDLQRYSSNGWNAYTRVCQDAQGWLREGIMDAIFPMMYFRGNQFYPFALDWEENRYGRMVCTGLGIYFLSGKERNWPLDIIARQMEVLRSNGLGHAYFRSKFFTENTKGIYSFARNQFDRFLSLIPPMTWQHSLPPTPPSRIDITRLEDADHLAWRGASDRSDGPYLTYNIYASATSPVDVADARNLIATRLVDSSLCIPLPKSGMSMNYAITATDRYGNESKPIYTPQALAKQAPTQFLPNDGSKLTLPSKRNVLDADVVAIETLQGGIVCTRPYTGKHIDITSVPEGVYILKSINSKGVAHRIGQFIIKRNNH